MPDQNQFLLQTKLHRPHVPHDLVERTRLLDWLNDGIDLPLILVSAPAGYGKTTLICTWLEHMAAGRGEGVFSLPSAWLSLDEDESEHTESRCCWPGLSRDPSARTANL